MNETPSSSVAARDEVLATDPLLHDLLLTAVMYGCSYGVQGSLASYDGAPGDDLRRRAAEYLTSPSSGREGREPVAWIVRCPSQIATAHCEDEVTEASPTEGWDCVECGAGSRGNPPLIWVPLYAGEATL